MSSEIPSGNGGASASDKHDRWPEGESESPVDSALSVIDGGSVAFRSIHATLSSGSVAPTGPLSLSLWAVKVACCSIKVTIRSISG